MSFPGHAIGIFGIKEIIMKKRIQKLSGAEIVTKVLLEENIDTVFGYPGGQVLHIYNELEKKRRKIKHILTAHEQGAAHAADGYARMTGNVGVVIATSGPGASNLVTGIATAYLDSVPMVVITGNVTTDQIGRDSFQELDIADITMPITKHNYIVKDVNKLYGILKEAFYIARSGRCGPVLVDIPKDIQIARCALSPLSYEATEAKPTAIKKSELDTAVKLISESKKPFIYCGGGAVSSGAGEFIEKLSRHIDAPIGCSLMGLSAVDSKYPGNMGFTGMYGSKSATMAMRAADLIIAVGARFTDRAIGSQGEYIESAKVLQIDIDPAEIDKNIITSAQIVGNAKQVLSELIKLLPTISHSEWREYIKSLPDTQPPREKDGLHPFDIIDSVAKYKDFAAVVTDVGQHQMWVAQRYKALGNRPLLTSGGLGTMGFGMGAAIGASIASSGKKVVLFTGDGSFGMNLNELATAVSYKIPLVVVIMNNRSLGMVKQWQKHLFGRTSQTDVPRKTDFAKLAEAFGGFGKKADSVEELKAALDKAFSTALKYPYVIDCNISADFEAAYSDK